MQSLISYRRKKDGFRKDLVAFQRKSEAFPAFVAKTGIEIKTAFFTKEALEKYPDYISAVAEKVEQAFEIPHELAGTLSDTREAQGVFCICVKRKEAELETIDPKGTYIALDNMQDPSNLGAVLRTAEAFGMSGVIVGGGCDIYNPKALRAAMGSSMRISVLTTGNLPSLLIFAAKKGMLTLASTPSDGAKKITDMSFSGSVICVVGNEGSGISPEVMSACTLPVTIPMRGRAESLNAAAAAAVLMWELTK